tara:strand:- start:29567 stop:29752 length:186 start_codon:yes stop_codon:yes gene_type:complete
MIDIEKLEDLVAGDYLTESMKELMIQQRDDVKRLRYHLDLMIEKFGEAYLIETLIERGEEE